MKKTALIGLALLVLLSFVIAPPILHVFRLAQLEAEGTRIFEKIYDYGEKQNMYPKSVEELFASGILTQKQIDLFQSPKESPIAKYEFNSKTGERLLTVDNISWELPPYKSEPGH